MNNKHPFLSKEGEKRLRVWASRNTHAEVKMTGNKKLCDPCKAQNMEEVASYDAKTIFGPWAYLCADCFETVGTGLGLGKGQKLIYEDD